MGGRILRYCPDTVCVGMSTLTDGSKNKMVKMCFDYYLRAQRGWRLKSVCY